MRKSHLYHLMILAAAMNGVLPYKEVNTPQRETLTDKEKERIAKQREGQLGDAIFHYNQQMTQFSD